jgi:monoamine oxidase
MPTLLNLVAKHGLSIRETRQDPGTLLLSQGKLLSGGEYGALTEEFWTSFRQSEPEEFDSIEDWLVSRQLDPATHALQRSGIEELWGRDPAELSFRSVSLELDQEDEPLDHSLAYSCAEGLEALAERMATALSGNLYRDSPVQSVGRNAGRFVVTTPFGGIESDYLVMACSPVMLGRLIWTAPEDQWLNDFSDRFAPGQMRKIVLRYQSAFWRGSAFGWMAQTDVPSGLSVIDSSDKAGGFETLTVFAGGRSAALWSGKDEAQVLSEVMKILEPILGPAVRNPVHVVQTDWVDHPWVGGGYNSWPRPWSGDDPMEILGQEHAGLHFACAEIAPGYRGYIEGALRSGAGAANRILKTMAGYSAGVSS